jgi:hypothetical protein
MTKEYKPVTSLHVTEDQFPIGFKTLNELGKALHDEAQSKGLDNSPKGRTIATEHLFSSVMAEHKRRNL